jgi:outer membrane protein
MLGVLSNVHAQDIKLGFVNSAQVLKGAPQAEQARLKLENEFAPRDKKILAMQKELKKLEDELNRDAAVMSETVKKQKERMLISQKRDIKRAQEEFNEDLNLRRNEELNALQQEVYETIVSLAKEQKFDVILGDSVMFASERVDITENVIERLKKAAQKKK